MKWVILEKKLMKPTNQTDQNSNKIYEKAFRKFIVDKNHPCIMAHSVHQTQGLFLRSYPDFDTQSTARQLVTDIKEYIQQYDFGDNKFASFIAVFPEVSFKDEKSFEQALWQLLNQIHQVDNANWDSSVSADPASNNFSFSIAGRAFYIVGMHPRSSRKARQAPYVSIAFNLHAQFEKLREMGSYEVVKKRIRKRDKAFQGSINPVLADFGDASEARQYSGRKTEKNWKCPFHKA